MLGENTLEAMSTGSTVADVLAWRDDCYESIHVHGLSRSVVHVHA